MKKFALLFFLSLIIYSGVIFKVGSIIWGDSLYYYAYTKSVIIDRDIDFANEAYRESDGFPNEPEVSEVTGKVINKFSPGSSILWMPAFALGYVVNGILGFTGLVGQVDGYGFLTQYLVAISTISFSIAGLFYVYKLVLLFFEKKVAFLTTLFLYFTTQMFYYTSIDPLNSHSASFMLSAMFLYLVVDFIRAKDLVKSLADSRSTDSRLAELDWKKMILLGGLAGMIILVRNQDIVVVLPTAIYLLMRGVGKLKNAGLMNFINKVVLFWGSVFLVMSIQLFATLSLYGRLGSPYLIGGEKLLWLRPDFVRVLFSFGNGLFTFAPILMVAVVGLFLSQKLSIKDGLKIKNKKLFGHVGLIALLSFALQLYVVASWGREIIGGPYGSRMFVSVLPHLALGLALIFDKYKNYSKFNIIVGMGLIILFANNLLQTAIMLIRF